MSFPKSGRTWLRIMLDELGIGLRYEHAGSAHLHALPIEQMPDPGALAGKQKIVFLHRDPRDVVVSGYFQASKRVGVFRGTMSEFLRDPRHGLHKILVFNRQWLRAAQGRNDICVVTYEAMHADVEAELRRVVAFFGKSVEPAALRKAIEAGRFETMQQNEASGVYEQRYGSVLAPGQAGDPESFKVRRGVVAGYVDYLSPEDLTYCDEVMAKERS
ncbi:MAG: sulfotransferase domain-containing protein [Xanthobacteraceae bacterium]